MKKKSKKCQHQHNRAFPPFTTPRNKNAAFPQTSIQSTAKLSVTPNHSQMDYQVFKPATTLRQTNKQRKVY